MATGDAFGKRLKGLLVESGIKQKELANAIGTTEAAVCRYVKGKRVPQGATMTRIAKVLGVPVEYLMPTRVEDVEKTDGYQLALSLVQGHCEEWEVWQCALLIGVLAKAIEKRGHGK